MNTPDASIETKFVPELRTKLDPLPADATLADLIARVNLLAQLLDQTIDDTIGSDGEVVETR